MKFRKFEVVEMLNVIIAQDTLSSIVYEKRCDIFWNVFHY